MPRPKCPCGKVLTAAQIAVAASRGRAAKYCSPLCRERYNKREQRAKAKEQI
jgi:hypothetical protein